MTDLEIHGRRCVLWHMFVCFTFLSANILLTARYMEFECGWLITVYSLMAESPIGGMLRQEMSEQKHRITFKTLSKNRTNENNTVY